MLSSVLRTQIDLRQIMECISGVIRVKTKKVRYFGQKGWGGFGLIDFLLLTLVISVMIFLLNALMRFLWMLGCLVIVQIGRGIV